MRIGIDARFFGPQETGIGRYVERLMTHLADKETNHEFVVFLRSKAWDWWQPPNSRWSKVRADVHWYGLREQLLMPGIYRSANLDLLHVPHFNVPLWYRHPFVVTIHDLILDQFPTERASTLGPILFRLKFLAYQRVVRHALRQARRVITVSEHSRRDVIQRMAIEPSRLAVTYESVDPLPPPVPLSALLEHGVQQPYLLHVGNSYPHKNLDRLVRATKLASDRGDRFQLVLVGKRDYFSRRLEHLIRQLGLTNVLFYGFAGDQELAALYGHARAYFFPSLSEGFGLPGLEAMQAGTPVFAARASCLPEIFGPAAQYFDPLQVEDIAQAIHQALHDILIRPKLVAAGYERLGHYSWSTMAQQTLAIYEQALAPHA